MRPLLLAIGILLAVAVPARAAYLGDLFFLPPHADYHRAETEHFHIVYPQEYEPEARAAAGYLEEAHSLLTREYRYSPRRKTTIVLADNEDHANGVTSAIGHQGIILLLTAPDPYSSIGEYDNWLRSLIIHEYSHYVTLDQTRGVFEFFRLLFGDTLLPNHGWPGFVAEGVAVQAETKFTARGRGSGAYYATLTRDALFRGDLGKPEFLTFDDLTGPRPRFPFGEMPYYAGYGIFEELSRELGEDGPGRLAEEGSWRVPYFLNGTLENVAVSKGRRDLDFQTLWRGWVDRMARSHKTELDGLRARGNREPDPLTPEGVSALGARLSPDETRVAYILQSGHERPSIHVVDLATRADRKLEDAISGAGLAWSADGNTLYFAKTDFRGPYALLSDLHSYDLRAGCSKRLTRGARAKDPDLCTENGTIVFTTQRGRISELKALDPSTGQIRTVYRAPDYHHVSMPRCVPGGKSVLFSEHAATSPEESVQEVALGADAGASVPRKLFGDGDFSALYPDPRPDGSVLFTRVKNRSFDLARWDRRTGKTTLIAHSSGGYWIPRLGRARTAVTYVTSQGIRAGVLDEASMAATVSEVGSPRHDASRESTGPGGSGQPSTSGVKTRSAAVWQSERYSLLTSLGPRIWSPLILLSDDQTQIGGAILGWDDTDQLEYAFTPYYDSVSRQLEGDFSTFHRLATFRTELSLSSQVTDFVAVGGGRREYSQERKLGVALARPFPGVFSSVEPFVLAEWARTRFDGDFGKIVFAPDQRIGAGISWDGRQAYPYSLTPERGWSSRAEGRRFFSGSARAWKALLNWDQFVPLDLPTRHSNLSLSLYAAVSPQPTSRLPATFVRVGGRGTLSDLDLPLRGYPLGHFDTRRAAVLQGEYRVPLAQLFRGFGTWPVFLRNLGVFGLYDVAKIQGADGSYGAPIAGVGGGFLLNTTLGYVLPFQIRIEAARGLAGNRGGEEVYTLSLGL